MFKFSLDDQQLEVVFEAVFRRKRAFLTAEAVIPLYVVLPPAEVLKRIPVTRDAFLKAQKGLAAVVDILDNVQIKDERVGRLRGGQLLYAVVVKNEGAVGVSAFLKKVDAVVGVYYPFKLIFVIEHLGDGDVILPREASLDIPHLAEVFRDLSGARGRLRLVTDKFLAQVGEGGGLRHTAGQRKKKRDQEKIKTFLMEIHAHCPLPSFYNLVYYIGKSLKR